MIYALAVLSCVLMFIGFVKSGSFFKAVFTSVLGGVGSLFAVGAVAYFIPLSLGVNLYSLVFSAVFSVPGVILMLLAQSFLF